MLQSGDSPLAEGALNPQGASASSLVSVDPKPGKVVKVAESLAHPG